MKSQLESIKPSETMFDNQESDAESKLVSKNTIIIFKLIVDDFSLETGLFRPSLNGYFGSSQRLTPRKSVDVFDGLIPDRKSENIDPQSCPTSRKSVEQSREIIIRVGNAFSTTQQDRNQGDAISTKARNCFFIF